MSDLEEIQVAPDMEVQTQDENVELPSFEFGLFIELVQKHEFLYDLSSADYKNIKKKDQAWEDIASIMNSTAEICKKIWRNLRDRFVKEKNKFKSGSEAPDPDLAWRYYHQMMFYGRYIKPRGTYTVTKKNIQKKPSQPKSTCSLSQPSGSGPIYRKIENEMLFSPSTTDDERSRSATPSKETPKQQRAPKRKNDDDDDVGEILKVAKELASSHSSVTAINKTFGEYVGAALDELPAHEAKEKRSKILKILENM